MLKPLSLLSTLMIAFSTATVQAEPLDAAEIMKRVDERYDGDTRESRAQLILIDKRDRQRVRDLTLFGLDTEEVEKSVIYFMSPADVEGTAYMAYDWEDPSREDDSWLYLPAMQKIKRVAASEESGAFMGSDFSYADINGIDYEDFTYTMIEESEDVDGHDCWVIESLPKDKSVIDKTGYTKSVNWIRKDNFVQVKGIINVEKGNRIKYFAARDLREVQGIWTAHTLQMVTTRNNKKEHASLFQITEVHYNGDVDASMFDTQAMQRGL